jgi:hypothetical protein
VTAAPAEAKKSEADLAYDAFLKVRDKPEAKYDAAEFDAIARAGIDFLKTYPTHRRAVSVVKSMADYDRKIQAPKKPATLAMRAMYASQVSLMISRQPSDLTPQADVALSALRVSMAGVVARADPTAENVSDWTRRLDDFQARDGAGPFLPDQMIAPYLMFKEARSPVAEKYLSALLTHSNAGVVARAKEEAALVELENNPLELSFTAMNGNAFSAESLRGTKVLVVHLFTLKSPGSLAEIDQICAEKGRRVEVIGICLDPKESAADVAKLLASSRIKWLVQHDGEGRNHPLAKALGVKDSANTVVFKIDGRLHARGVSAGKLGSQLDGLLATKAK